MFCTFLDSSSEKDIADVCTDVLDRTSSRLEVLIEEHREKMENNNEYNPDSARSLKSENNSQEADVKLGQIGEKMKSFLDKLVEVSNISFMF